MKAHRVIVAGGVVKLRQELRSALEHDGHVADEAETAVEALNRACSGLYDLLVLNSAMEGTDSYWLCRAIRTKSEIGIIVVESGTSAIDALNAGADEYVSAPFTVGELLARIRAVLRRVGRTADQRILLQDRAIDLASRKVKGPGGQVSHLTPKEYLVLQCLVDRPNEPRTHQSLAQTVWQRDGNGEVEYMRIVIKQLRRKLEPDPANPRYILTEKSIGYRFHMPAA